MHLFGNDNLWDSLALEDKAMTTDSQSLPDTCLQKSKWYIEWFLFKLGFASLFVGWKSVSLITFRFQRYNGPLASQHYLSIIYPLFQSTNKKDRGSEQVWRSQIGGALANSTNFQ